MQAGYTPRPGDWQCMVCQNTNWASRMSCNRCATARPSPIGIASSPYTVAYSSTGVTGATAGAKPQPGDWYCGNPSCCNFNFAKRNTCNRCGAPQPGYVAGYEAALRGEPLPSTATLVDTSGIAKVTSDGEATRGLDWKCTKCQNINFARRTECNRCKSPKDTSSEEVLPTGFSGGNAVPPSMSLLLGTNYTLPQASVGVSYGKQTPGSWNCVNPACGSNNYGHRQTCHKCNTPRPAESSSGDNTDNKLITAPPNSVRSAPY